MMKAVGCPAMLFEFFAYLTGLAVLALVVLAWVMYRDPFHPAIYFGPMLVFLYAFLPLYLSFTQREELRGLIDDGDLVYVQLLNGLGAISLCLGVLLGSAPAPGRRPPATLAAIRGVRAASGRRRGMPRADRPCRLRLHARATSAASLAPTGTPMAACGPTAATSGTCST